MQKSLILAIILLIFGVSLAYAGGGDWPPEQQMVQKAIEVTVKPPEEDWTDYLKWLLPGVFVPIGIYWLSRRHKHG